MARLSLRSGRHTAAVCERDGMTRNRRRSRRGPRSGLISGRSSRRKSEKHGRREGKAGYLRPRTMEGSCRTSRDTVVGWAVIVRADQRSRAGTRVGTAFAGPTGQPNQRNASAQTQEARRCRRASRQIDLWGSIRRCASVPGSRRSGRSCRCQPAGRRRGTRLRREPRGSW